MTPEIPLISIVTPVFNGAEYLTILIESVLKQESGAAWEHIIIDDGSTDEGATQAVLKRYSHLRWWTRENKGQYATMNEGLRAARGEWVCFVSADDLVYPGAFHNVAHYIGEYPDCEWVYGSTVFICADGTRHPVQSVLKQVPPRWFAYLNGIYHCSMYVKRATLLETNLFFDEHLKYSSDFDWIMRLIRSGAVHGYVNQPLASLRTHADRASIVFLERQKSEHAMLLERYGVSKILHRAINDLLYLRSMGLEVFALLRKGRLERLKIRARQWYLRHFRKERNGTT